MAFIEIGTWWDLDKGRKTDYVAPLLVRPFSYKTVEGDYLVGWQPIVPDVLPASF